MPSTALREVSLLQMLSESIFVVRCAAGGPFKAAAFKGAGRDSYASTPGRAR